jgi:hypothetical protein
MMDAIEHNNRERVSAFGKRPASEMTKRERIAVDTLAAIVGVEKPYNDEAYNQCVESAIVLTDKLIKRLNENA